MGENAICIHHGLDMDKFRIATSPAERTPNQLMMLHHHPEWKGCEDGPQARSLVWKQDPDMRASFFGVPARPETLPDWIEYHRSPSPEQLRALYDRAAIFVAPSRTEGLGLTGCEALLCGAALVANDIDGHRESVFDGQTALTCAVRSPHALAENIRRLIQDPALRIQLAKNGLQFIRQFKWERASTSLEAALCATIFEESGHRLQDEHRSHCGYVSPAD